MSDQFALDFRRRHFSKHLPFSCHHFPRRNLPLRKKRNSCMAAVLPKKTNFSKCLACWQRKATGLCIPFLRISALWAVYSSQFRHAGTAAGTLYAQIRAMPYRISRAGKILQTATNILADNCVRALFQFCKSFQF